jgi:amidophosphoribosyltransferase
MMTRDRIFAARDPRGFRPLSMGRMKNAEGPDSIVFASESCAFDLLRAEFIRDVLPGELVMVSQDGVTSRQYASGFPQSSCVFEHVYFARPDSRIFGRWVQESRDQMGRQLARESGVPADVVVPVPDSGVTAALGYAEEAGLPSAWASSATTTSAAHLSSPSSASATSASASSSTPCTICSPASASSSLTTPSFAARPAAKSCAWCAARAQPKFISASVARPPSRPAFMASTRRLRASSSPPITLSKGFASSSRLTRSPICRLKGCLKSVQDENKTGYCTACYTGNYPTQWVDVEDILPAAVTT